MKRGISFEISNEYGNFLKEILEPIDITLYDWYIGGEESYAVENNHLEPLFLQEIYGMEGTTLKHIIEKPNQYLIFLNIKAFTKGKQVVEVSTFEEYVKSDCQLVLIVIDSSYVIIYCKENDKLEQLYRNAVVKGYNKLEYMTNDNDFRTKLSVW